MCSVWPMQKFPLVPLKEDKRIEELESLHGDVIRVQTVLGYAYFRGLTEFEFAEYTALILDEKKRHSASRVACENAVVFPEVNTFREWAASKPGIPTKCVSKVLELSVLDDSGND